MIDCITSIVCKMKQFAFTANIKIVFRLTRLERSWKTHSGYPMCTSSAKWLVYAFNVSRNCIASDISRMQTREWLSVSVSLSESLSKLTLNARQLREIIIDRMIWILMQHISIDVLFMHFHSCGKKYEQYIDKEISNFLCWKLYVGWNEILIN